MEDDQELIASLNANQAHDRRLFAAIMKAAKQGNVAALPALLSTEPQDDEQWHFCGRVAAAIGRHGTIHPAVRERLVAFWVDCGEDLRAELSRAEAIRFTKAVFEPYRGNQLLRQARPGCIGGPERRRRTRLRALQASDPDRRPRGSGFAGRRANSSNSSRRPRSRSPRHGRREQVRRPGVRTLDEDSKASLSPLIQRQ
jgi:hypothetical protein